MAKVLVRRAIPTLIAVHTCLRCSSEVEYEEADLRRYTPGTAPVPGRFVECPVCMTAIANELLRWQKKESTASVHQDMRHPSECNGSSCD